MKFVSQQNAEKLNRTGEKQVRFCGESIGGLAPGNAKRIFECVDETFHSGAAATLQDWQDILTKMYEAGKSRKYIQDVRGMMTAQVRARL